MITINGYQLNDNFYLSGLESAPGVAYKQHRTLSGGSVLTATPNQGGRQLTLGTQQAKSIQGIWCKGAIDHMKAIESSAQSVELNYRGDLYQVLIVGTEFEPLFIFEEESSTKRFIGTITMIEA